ncbi:MAG: HAD family hydrolase [Prevotella sp.]|jgi:HAD superfamily hydrolase (TIGR01509 family)
MIKNIIFDYGGVLVQYDFAGFFGKLLGSREKGEWFMDNVLPDEVNREMDRELHPFSFYIHRQQQRWPDYADALDYFDKHYTDAFTSEMPGMRQFMMELKEKGFHLFGLSNWSSKLSEVKDKFSIFSLIEKELVSKDVHLLKPDPSIYRAFLSKFSLDPAFCLFIDDKQENINGCKTVGMNGFHFDSNSPRESIESIKNLLREVKDKP